MSCFLGVFPKSPYLRFYWNHVYSRIFTCQTRIWIWKSEQMIFSRSRVQKTRFFNRFARLLWILVIGAKKAKLQCVAPYYLTWLGAMRNERNSGMSQLKESSHVKAVFFRFSWDFFWRTIKTYNFELVTVYLLPF